MSRTDKYDFDTVVKFGRHKGATIGEILEDGDCSLIMYYINENIIQVTNEVYDEMRMTCAGSCPNCKDMF